MKTLFDDVIYNNELFTFKYYKVNNYKDIINLNSLFINYSSDYNQKDLTAESFSFANVKELEIKKKIEKVGTPLKDWDINIYRGVLTGFNEAFIISTKKKEEILNNCKDSIELEKTKNIIKPILRGRDIKKYSYEWSDLWLINSHNGVREKNIPPIDINDYPAIKNHLDNFYPQLEKRSDKGNTPYNLRNCAYLDEFEKEKIVWNPVSGEYFFTFLNLNFYFNNSLFMITGKNIKYILSIMNSIFMKWLLIQMTNLVETGKYAYGAKDKIELLPIPQISEEEQKPFVKLVEEILAEKKENPNADTTDLEEKIDELVYELYELTKDEIKIVEKRNK